MVLGSDGQIITWSADGRRAYAGGAANTVFQFNIAPDGTLSPLTPATVTAGNFPSAIALSPDGRAAYVTNFSDRTVAQYAIGADGTLSPRGSAATGTGPVAIALSPDGTRVVGVGDTPGGFVNDKLRYFTTNGPAWTCPACCGPTWSWPCWSR